jgi:hypothetical protein
MTTTVESTTTRLRKPLYAVAGAGELAYRRLQRLPEQVEALRELITPRVRSLRDELPGRVEALRAEVPSRVTTFVAGARHVYSDLVAHGEKIVARHPESRNGAAVATVPAKAVRKPVKKAVKKAGSKGPKS